MSQHSLNHKFYYFVISAPGYSIIFRISVSETVGDLHAFAGRTMVTYAKQLVPKFAPNWICEFRWFPSLLPNGFVNSGGPPRRSLVQDFVQARMPGDPGPLAPGHHRARGPRPGPGPGAPGLGPGSGPGPAVGRIFHRGLQWGAFTGSHKWA